MNTLLLVAQLLSYLPLNSPMPAQSIAPASGVGTLIVAGCEPGTRVVILPGPLLATADESGTAKVQAPAQNRKSEPYQILTTQGDRNSFNGTLAAREVLTAACP